MTQSEEAAGVGEKTPIQLWVYKCDDVLDGLKATSLPISFNDDTKVYHMIEHSAYAKLKEEHSEMLKVMSKNYLDRTDAFKEENALLRKRVEGLRLSILRLTKVGPPSISTTGADWAITCLKDNCQIASDALFADDKMGEKDE